MNSTQPITAQLQSFAIFAVVMLALGSFQQTHTVAIFILAFVAVAIIIKKASGG